jgi:hypothetical protein
LLRGLEFSTATEKLADIELSELSWASPSLLLSVIPPKIYRTFYCLKRAKENYLLALPYILRGVLPNGRII